MAHNIKWKEGEEVTLTDGLGAKSNKKVFQPVHLAMAGVQT